MDSEVYLVYAEGVAWMAAGLWCAWIIFRWVAA